jgi:hypothetical protein
VVSGVAVKTFLLLVLVALLALIAVNRRRIYVRDPLATVYRTDAKQNGKSDARQNGKTNARENRTSELTGSGNSNQSQGVVTESLQSAMDEQVQSGRVMVPHQSGNAGQSQDEVTKPLQKSVSGVLQAERVEQLQKGVTKVLDGGEAGVRKSGLAGLLQSVDSGLPQGDGKDGRQSGVQVFVSAQGDVLLWRDAQPGGYRILVQGWNKTPGTPMRLTCIRWIVCLADADHASTIPLDWTGNSGRGRGRYDPQVTMSGRRVTFVDGAGALMRMELR